MDDTLKSIFLKGIKRDEGFRALPYKDSRGILTIGYGRNLRDVGISEDEAAYLAQNDLAYCYAKLSAVLPIFPKLDAPRQYVLDAPRQYVLTNMCYNLGIYKLMNFKDMLAALEVSDYTKAANEMKSSIWYSQVGDRAVRLCDIMKNGNKSQYYTSLTL